jgi:nitrite reductase/ring-hydroxylating ferredoxin subunit
MANGADDDGAEARFWPIAPASSLVPGQFSAHIVNGRAVLLANVDGAYFCIEDKCSHADSPLSIGRLRGSKILCPLHGARFDVRTGEHLGPPAVRGVASFPVRVVDGVVEACVHAVACQYTGGD